jgi:hypothetical protein
MAYTSEELSFNIFGTPNGGFYFYTFVFLGVGGVI